MVLIKKLCLLLFFCLDFNQSHCAVRFFPYRVNQNAKLNEIAKSNFDRIITVGLQSGLGLTECPQYV